MRLDALHRLIQVVVGWEDSHLHVFSKGDRRYSAPSPWGNDFTMPGMPRDLDATKYRISQLLKREKDWMTYTSVIHEPSGRRVVWGAEARCATRRAVRGRRMAGSRGGRAVFRVLNR